MLNSDDHLTSLTTELIFKIGEDVKPYLRNALESAQHAHRRQLVNKMIMRLEAN